MPSTHSSYVASGHSTPQKVLTVAYVPKSNRCVSFASSHNLPRVPHHLWSEQPALFGFLPPTGQLRLSPLQVLILPPSSSATPFSFPSLPLGVTPHPSATTDDTHASNFSAVHCPELQSTDSTDTSTWMSQVPPIQQAYRHTRGALSWWQPPPPACNPGASLTTPHSSHPGHHHPLLSSPALPPHLFYPGEGIPLLPGELSHPHFWIRPTLQCSVHTAAGELSKCKSAHLTPQLICLWL